MFLFYSLFEKLSEYLSSEKIGKIADAYLYAADAHETQFRTSGEPYIIHPVAVCNNLAHIQMDLSTIIAALLHDVVEDTEINIDDIRDIFGDKVSELVEGVTKLTQLSGKTKNETHAESMRKMILAMVKDIRVIVIKLADRLHNMETIGAMSPKKQAKKARETFDIFAPLANRLGMFNYKNKLEDLCFKALYPLRYQVLDKCVRVARGSRQKVLDKIHQQLLSKLLEFGIDSSNLFGRQKRLYSIFKKMRHRRQAFSEIMDVYAFRIIAPDVNSCYQLLGVVHSLYVPIPGRFKDYIAIPKANGYQSLHTSLYGPQGIPLEVQIRTKDMDLMANEGIASHWLYKDQKEDCMTDLRTKNWLNRLSEFHISDNSSEDFIEHVKIDLFPKEVFVFTPNGEIVQLPVGSTVIDFAYAVHTQVGHACIAAKINRRISPLSQELENGMTVEILTSSMSMPNPMWLNFVKTARARSAIRNYFNQKEKSEMIDLGRKLLQYGLSEHNINWINISNDMREILFNKLEITGESELFMEIGSGDRSSAVVAYQLSDIIKFDGEYNNKANDLADSEKKQGAASITIVGSEGVHLSYANCCYPIPGDQITGVLKKGEGIEVHCSSCLNLKNMDYSKQPQDFVVLNWANDLSNSFTSKVVIEMNNTTGALAKVAVAVSKEKCNIRMLHVEEVDTSYAIVSMLLEVSSRTHLADLIRHIRQLRHVMRVFRWRLLE